MDLESEIDIFYDCDECDQTFSSGSEMETHKMEVHAKRYKCQFCELGFSKLSGLNFHISYKHRQNAAAMHAFKQSQEREMESTEEKDSKCAELEQVKETRSKENARARKKYTKLYTCYDCNKTFTTSRGMKHHVSIVHESKRLYSCPDCSQSFRLESTLEKHIDREHLKIGKESLSYKCDECGKTLQNGCLFHVCKNEVPLTCEECGESFERSDDYKAHKKSVHKREFTCTECDKSFKIRETLDVHLRRYHPEKHIEMYGHQENPERTESLKKQKCEFCEFAFARPENLKRHIQRMHKTKVIS